MSSKPSFSELLEQKKVRFLLAAVCGLFAMQSLYQLLGGTGQADWLRGGGGLLLWGGWAVVNALKPYGRSVQGINAAINIGLVLVVASWVVRS